MSDRPFPPDVAATHPPAAVLDGYAAGRLADASAASVELHTQHCAPCLAAVSGRADRARLDDNWTMIVAELASPEPRRPERVLRRLGASAETARLLVATPSLRRAWFIAIGVALLFALAAGAPGREGGSLLLFLVLAPLVPVAGVALAYGRGVDPAHEITVATPMSGLRVLLVRAVAVLGTTLATAGVVSLLLIGRRGVEVAAWLLPSLGLSLVCLALTTALRPRLAGSLVAGAWVLAVATASAVTGDELAAFGAAGQGAALVLAAIGGAVLVARRRRLDLWGPA